MGDTAYFLELCVEGAIQDVKRKLTGNRGTSAPEECIVNELEFARCITLFSCAGPTPCKSVAEQVSEMKAQQEARRQAQLSEAQRASLLAHQLRQQQRKASRMDTAPSTDAGSRMLGAGRRFEESPGNSLHGLLVKVRQLLADMNADAPPAQEAEAALAPHVDEALAAYDVLPMYRVAVVGNDDHVRVDIGEGWHSGLLDGIIATGSYEQHLGFRCAVFC